ncbi:MAG: outer membrane lipoprotein-sorting protein [Verrucomicrobiota bacterium]
MAALIGASSSQAQTQITPEQLLAKARESIASMTGNFEGWLIQGIGVRKAPFVLQTAQNGQMNYFFKDPNEVIRVIVGKANGGNDALTKKLRGTDVTMEDLTVHQLGWKVTNVREGKTGVSKCYVVTVQNNTGKGAYTHADIWIQQGALALMRLDAYNRAGLAKKLEVQGIRKVGNQRIASKMRVSTYSGGRKRSSTSIHLDGD